MIVPFGRPARRPFAGAWIETSSSSGRVPIGLVAPSRGRGSKHGHLHPVGQRLLSPLRGGVDRNCGSERLRNWLMRRPFAGAWIETCPLRHPTNSCASRPFAGAWIETAPLPWRKAPADRSPLRGGVDRNTGEGSPPQRNVWSPLRGGVDRNLGNDFQICDRNVAPSRGRGSKPRLHRRWPS